MGNVTLTSHKTKSSDRLSTVGQRSVASEIRRLAELQGDRIAIIATEFKPISYSELQSLITEIRATLRHAGLDCNARVAVAISQPPHAALAIIAVTCSAVCVPLNPKQTLREVELSLDSLRPDAVVLLKGAESVVRKAAAAKQIKVIEFTPAGDGTFGFTSVPPQIEIVPISDDHSEDPDPDAPAFILQTSGTASEPKLIPFSHRNMLAAAARVQGWFNLSSQDRCLSASPLFYSHGLKVTVFTPLLTGGSLAFPTDAGKVDYAEWFGVLRPTWYSAGPTLHQLVLDQAQLTADAPTMHSLRFVMSGGAPLPRNILEGLQQTLGIPVVEHYGSSEAAQISANLPPPGRSKIGTCGIPAINIIKIVDDDGGELPIGERGEVLVGGPTVTSGYLNNAELNRACFVDGWFRTGDIGSVDKDGFLILHGRKSDLINRGGEKISPVEVDDALMRHPAVLEAAAFPIPHSRLGEDIAAAVVLRPGMASTSIEIRKYLQEQIAGFKIPRRIIFQDQLPKGSTGKVLRRRLSGDWHEKARTQAQTPSPLVATRDTVDKEIVEKLVELWRRLLKVDEISIDDDFFDKGGDSLLAVEMLAELEARTGFSIPDTVLFEATTIRQLAQRLSNRASLTPKRLVEMNAGGTRPPLIYFHGNFYRFGTSAIMLSKLLGSVQPLLVVAPHGAGDEPIPSSIEAMAADRLPLILNAQPNGPYRLAGKCLGGIVAFEVARMLVAAGKEVEMVIMIDTPTINARKSVRLLFAAIALAQLLFGSIVESVMAWTWFRCVQIQRFWHYPWSKRSAAIKRRLPAMQVDAGAVGGEKVAPTRGEQANEQDLDEWKFTDPRVFRYAVAMSHYRPDPLAVRVIYVKVEFDPGAWKRISADLDIAKSLGTHEVPDYADVARHLSMRLQPIGH